MNEKLLGLNEIVSDQRSLEWHQARAGKVTGTTLGRAVGSPKVQETFMYELLAEMMSETMPDDLNVPAVVRGRNMEPFAIAQAKEDLELVFEPAGFCMSELIPGFGLSPDNVVKKFGYITGGLEIKCPDTKTHLKYIVEDTIPKEYRHQVLAPFVASDRVAWWYFMSYDDRCYERPTFYKKVEFEEVEEEVLKIREDLKVFLEKLNKAHLQLTF